VTDPAPPTAQDIRDVFAADALPDSKYSDELVDGFVLAFIQVVVTARGLALWPIETVERQTVRTHGSLLVNSRPLRSVSAFSWRAPGLAVTSSSTEVDGDLLEAINTNGIDGPIGRVSGIPAPCGSQVTLTVNHGLEEAPGDAVIVCAEYVRKRAKETVGNKPRQAVPTEDGQNFNYSVPQADPSKDRWTGIPVVDTAIGNWTDYRIPGIA